jgi:AcrR family transcriptional regulator
VSETEGSQQWIEAGLAELAGAGIAGVRIEVLAERLGVTKGGFYRRFKDRRALLDAMLDAWASGRIAAIEQQTALGGETPATRLRSVIKLYSERQNPQGIAIELAMRQWARSDSAAADAVTRVDAGRMKAVQALYRGIGHSPVEAEARAMIFYAFIFGESLLFLGQSPRKRAALLSACAAALTTEAL